MSDDPQRAVWVVLREMICWCGLFLSKVLDSTRLRNLEIVRISRLTLQGLVSGVRYSIYGSLLFDVRNEDMYTI